MSTKFEQLLDYLVNEEMDKANALFHEIVVEKSRDIYETLIAEEADDEEDEAVDEAAEDDEQDESVDEAVDEELEDSYMMDGDDTGMELSDPTDKLGIDVMDTDSPEDDGEMDLDDESSEDAVMGEIKSAIAELEAAFAELQQIQGSDDTDMDFNAPDTDSEEDGKEDEMEMMGKPAFEGRRMTREYVEKVGNDWDKNGQKTQGQAAGADTGDKMGSPAEGKSPISSGKGKPTTGAGAGNIAQKGTTHDEDGTKPHGKAGGLVKNAQTMNTGNGNVPGGKKGVKDLTKVAGGHGAEKKGASSEGQAAGAGTGDTASTAVNTRSVVDRQIR